MSRLDPQTMFLLVLVLAGLAALVYFVVRSQVFAACALLVIFLLSDGIRDNFGLSVTVSGFRVSALDALCGILLGVGVYRALTLGVRSFARGLSLALLALLVLHIARGMLNFSLHEAINASRTWIYFTAPLVFAATAPRPWDRLVWKLIASTGIALALISIPYFLIDGLHTATQNVYRNGHQLTTARPIVAAGALVVLQAAILLPVLGWPSRRKRKHCTGRRDDRSGRPRPTSNGLGRSLGRGGDRLRPLVETATARRPVARLWRNGAPLPRAARARVRVPSLRRARPPSGGNDGQPQYVHLAHHELAGAHCKPPLAQQRRDRGACRCELGTSDRRFDCGRCPLTTRTSKRFFASAPGLAIFLGLWVVVWKRKAGVPRYVGLTSTAIVLLLTSQALFGIAYSLGEVQGFMFGIFISGLTLAHDEKTAGFARLSLRAAAVPQGRAVGALSRTTT